MDPNFKKGFEKNAIVGSIARFAVKKMPKIFKHLTHKAGKFNAGRTAGTALTGGFVGMEGMDVLRKTRSQVNRRIMV